MNKSKRFLHKVQKGSRKLVKIHHRRKKVITYLLFGRFLAIVFLLIVQFFSLYLLGTLLNPLLTYTVNGIGILSIIFIIYLVNTSSKPEFKLSWLVLVAILPVFGILLYLILKLNIETVGMKKKLKITSKKMKDALKDEATDLTTTETLNPIKDIVFYLQNTCGFPIYQDFGITYFPNGESMFDDILHELKSAKDFVFIEFFIIGMGKFWDSILEILIKKAQKGVEIRIMYDGIGSMMLLPSSYPEYLQSLGIKAKVFSPLIPLLSTHQNNRDHRKNFIIDGKVAYTGGLNLEDEYANFRHNRFNYWKDTAIKLSGVAVKTFTAMFLQTWNLTEKLNDDWTYYTSFSTTKNKLLNNTGNCGGVIIPYGDDALNNEDIAKSVYCNIINKARNYVHITTPYLLLDSEFETALVFAVKRGVEVSILVPARADHFITFCIGRTFIKSLIDKGVKVYEYTPGFIHAKMFVSDDIRAVVGSINLDYRSLYHHFEIGTYIYDNPIILEIEKDFCKTRQECKQINKLVYKKIPIHQRIIGRFAKMFAPLL